MSEIIASTYQLLKKLGSGGGGVIYLAEHLRLHKKVVLKADRRPVSTSPEMLRREVDVLKTLKHPHIPQVYDYFSEDGTVYTAMEYVEGESLDQGLKRGERYTQAQVVQWACQLLDALDYLHRPIHGDPPRGYIHSDVKPANIMRLPDDSICLIDFNISLAIGEENVIGCSAGYASPEHYGLDFSTENSLTLEAAGDPPQEETEFAPQQDATVTATERRRSRPMDASPRTPRLRVVVPDVRSDIYSVGATLYHLVSGIRPDSHAKAVRPLTAEQCSPLVAGIINRAMDPNPDRRFQTAAEMLSALLHLKENDPRTRRLRRARRLHLPGSTGCIRGR